MIPELLGYYDLVDVHSECCEYSDVANLYGQLNYGRGSNFTSYSAFSESLTGIVKS